MWMHEQDIFPRTWMMVHMDVIQLNSCISINAIVSIFSIEIHWSGCYQLKGTPTLQVFLLQDATSVKTGRGSPLWQTYSLAHNLCAHPQNKIFSLPITPYVG
ncbi:hypothetical protein O6H91_08G117100 [Diphasiastrum complanatum]|uniref:Uncharacterized protein n=1 Tax=Diphasiastrum complanatum TaxID=34168 RepID=A0ACC2D1F7_DIPCM|nr:hypothetical protein O6H91_08G117100 [Diphasiastrum complanatum]